MSVIRDRRRSSAGEYFAYFADPYGFTRTIALYFWDVLLELTGGPPPTTTRRGARPPRRGVSVHEGSDHRDHARPERRHSARRHRRGRSVVYSTFVGYDEVAHHSGIEQPDAFAVLKQHDAQLARLERAVEQAPRPYHLVVLSDHGQSQGRPFRQRYRLELGDLVQDALRVVTCSRPRLGRGIEHGRRRADRCPRRGQRRRQDTRARHPGQPGRRAGRARAQPRGGRGGEADASEHEAVVLASGGLGLIYLPEHSQRMAIGEIDGCIPG